MKPQAAEQEQVKKPGSSPEFGLLLRRLEEAALTDAGRDRLDKILRRETVWKRLPPGEAMRWARLAQIMGMCELSLEVLAWVNARHPENTDAWQQRIELLEILGKGARISPETPTDENSTPSPPGPRASVPMDPARVPPWEDGLETPFAAMRETEEALDRYLRLFQGREDCFARQWADRKEGTQGYVPVRRPMTAADVQEHVNGLRTYGIYLLQRDSRVRLAVVDADLAPRFRSGTLSSPDRELLAREKRYLLGRLPEIGLEKKLPCLVEFSGGKGFHFWYLFSEPVPAAAARRALQELVRHLAADLSCFTLEVFPKQDQLAGKGLGNLVKLPLGIHRATGKPSFFLHVPDRSAPAQLAALKKAPVIAPSRVMEVAGERKEAEVRVHPRREAWAARFPELALLGERCTALSQIFVSCRQARTLSVREEKVLLGTLGFLDRGKTLVHHLMRELPEYNPHLVDFRLSRLRGKPLGCRKIHALLGLTGDLCPFEKVPEYAHPLLHWPDWKEEASANRAERIGNLREALEELKRAISVVERFVDP